MRPLWFACLLWCFSAVAFGALPDAVDRTADNVVRVQVGTSKASGVYVGSQYVLTARHLFDDENTASATVTFRVGDERVSGRLVSAIDSAWDSAVIQLDREPADAVKPLAVSRDLRPGDVLWVAGYSQGNLQYRHGPFVAFRHLKQYASQPKWYVEFKAPCYSGDSGGPVFLSDGSLVGTMWGSGGPHGPRCSNEFHRTYSVALCAKFTRRLIGAILPRGNLFPRGRSRCPSGGCPDGQNRDDCPGEGCPVPGTPGETPRAPWDGGVIGEPPDDPPDDPQSGESPYRIQWLDGDGNAVPPPSQGPPVAQVDLSGIMTELAALRETIEAIQRQPGLQGEQGIQGEAGKDGTSPVIDYDKLAAEVEQRLKPIYVQHIDEVTGVETVEQIFLGEGFTIRNSIPK